MRKGQVSQAGGGDPRVSELIQVKVGLVPQVPHLEDGRVTMERVLLLCRSHTLTHTTETRRLHNKITLLKHLAPTYKAVTSHTSLLGQC